MHGQKLAYQQRGPAIQVAEGDIELKSGKKCNFGKSKGLNGAAMKE